MAFDFFFAGTQCQESTDLLCKLNANVLKSYMNDRKELDKWFENRRKGWTGKLFVDSGAFTVHKQGGEVDVDKYIEYLNKYEPYITYYIQLDSIPGVWGKPRTYDMVLKSCEKTWNNYVYMRKYLINGKKLCPVYHMGEPVKALHRILDSKYEFDCMCVSGAKDLTASQRMDWYQKILPIVKSKRPNVKVHGLGIGVPETVESIQFDSIDATSWIMTGANGSILTDYGIVYVSYEGRHKKNHINNMPQEAVNKIKKYCEDAGYNFEEVQKSYKLRTMLNILYLFNKSNNIEYIYNPIKKGSLFEL